MIKPATAATRVRPSWFQVAFLAAIGPIILALAALWLGSEIRRGTEIREAIRTSVQAQREMTELFSLLKDAETGQRGYILSGDRAFLAPYEQALSKLNAQIALIDQLTPAQGSDQAELRMLKQLIRTKFVEMQKVIAVRETEGLSAAAERLRQGQGKRLMDQIREVITAKERQRDAQLQAEQRADADRILRSRTVLWSIIISFALAALVVGFMIGRGMRQRALLTMENEELSERRRAIFDSVTDALVIINPSGSIETLNHFAEQLFGYSERELLRRDIGTLIDIAPGDGPFLDRLGFREEQIERPDRIDVIGRRRDGEAVIVDVALGTMPLPDGIHIVAAIRDATSRKEVDRLKDDFISTVSHELRTPLTSLVGSLGLLRSGAAGELPPAAQRLADIAESNSQRLIRLINDILDMDQIRRGRMAFDYAVIDLREVMSRTVETMQGFADQRPAKILLDMPDQPVLACADADRLVQVAGNLLSNAIKFSPPGAHVSFELIAGGEDHLIQVTDQGPGIKQEFAHSMFNRFAQGARPEQQMIAGTGLGLAISREIVRSHGGDIGFENRAEGGARFSFNIPRDSAHGVEGAGSSRLLICEAERDAGFTLQSILTAHGFASDLVATMREGIAHARSRAYKAVLIDYQLADAEGLDIIRALRADNAMRHLPIIIISDIPPHPDVDSNAYVGWLQKPFDPPRLIQLVQRAIRHAGQRKAVILHVDDDSDTRELFAAALAGRGLLLGATSLASARTILAARRPDAIVLDIGLPDGSGQDLLVETKAAEQPLPVIVYSAQEIAAPAKALADAVILKSRRSLPKLANTVLEVVERHGGPQ